MATPRFNLGAAYHEAGHAVARVFVGAPATDTRIFLDGTGYSDGRLQSWRSANAGLGTVWDLLLVYMAGTHAEARATKRSYQSLCLSAGLKDYAAASVLVMLLSQRSGVLTEQAVWQQADKERRAFLRGCWFTIATVAKRLQQTGIVSDSELRTITKRYRRKLVTSLNRPNV